jgi:molybdopterin synthase sulfur carrier subunit
MKIKLELFGASRDFSDKDHLELEVKDKASIDDLRNEIIKYIDKNFQGNEDFIKVVKSSAFCSENNEIISDNYKITKIKRLVLYHLSEEVNASYKNSRL